MVSWNLAAVVGVSGVGKTSLCRAVAREIGYNHLNYGDLMLNIAREKNLAQSEKEMFSLDMDIQYLIWKKAALEIRNHENALVDLHGLDQSLLGYLISLPLEIISPEIIVVVHSSPENILIRRKNDRAKDRIKDDLKSLKYHQEMLKKAMLVSSIFLGINIYFLRNDNFNSAKRELLSLLA